MAGHNSYAEHYDATVAKGLCFECGERKPRVNVYTLNDGRPYKGVNILGSPQVSSALPSGGAPDGK